MENYDEARTLLERIGENISRFAAGARRRWITIAIRRVRDRRPDVLRPWLRILPESPSAARSGRWLSDAGNPGITRYLQALLRQLAYFHQCARECATIRRLLRRIPSGDVRYDTFMDALLDAPEVLKRRGVADWLGDQDIASRPVLLEHVVPPVSLDELTVIRRSLDAKRKRFSRRLRQLRSESRLIRESVGTLGHEDTMTLKEAVAELTEDDQRLLVWRFKEGWTLETIALALGIHKSVACRRLARVIDSLARRISPERK